MVVDGHRDRTVKIKRALLAPREGIISLRAYCENFSLARKYTGYGYTDKIPSTYHGWRVSPGDKNFKLVMCGWVN